MQRFFDGLPGIAAPLLVFPDALAHLVIHGLGRCQITDRRAIADGHLFCKPALAATGTAGNENGPGHDVPPYLLFLEVCNNEKSPCPDRKGLEIVGV
jgi:hypothetical protein